MEILFKSVIRTYVFKCQQFVSLEGKVHLVGHQHNQFILEKATDTPVKMP